MTDDIITFGAVSGALAAILGLAGLLWRGWRIIQERVITPIGQMWEDWQGEPERPGVPARLGVMARLDVIERIQGDQAVVLADQTVTLDAIQAQLSPNGGGSMYDKITQVRDAVRGDR